MGRSGTVTQGRTRYAAPLAVALALCALWLAPVGAQATPLPPTVGPPVGFIPDHIVYGEATLWASVNPNGSLVTDCYFVWTTNGGSGQTPCQPMPGDGTSPVDVSVDVPAPGSSATYYVVATNAGGTTTGPVETTGGGTWIPLPPFPPPPPPPPPPPTITNSGVQTIARPIATARASIDPNGSATDCYFEDLFDGTHIPCSPSPGDGSAPIWVTGGIPVHGSLIEFRAVATNAGGTVYGPATHMEVFWAPPPPPQSPPPVTVPPPVTPPSPPPASTQPQTVPAPPAGQPASPATIAVLSIERRVAHGHIGVLLACRGAGAGDCRGTLRLVAHVRLHGRRVLVVLGTASYDLTAPEHARLTVPLLPRGRRLLAQRRTVRVSALV